MSTKKKIEKIEEELKYYTLDRINKENAHYNIIYGMRSNGKTYAVQRQALEDYIKNGNQLGLVRRYDTDFQGKRGTEMFKNLMCNDKGENSVEILSGGKWTDIFSYSGRWYLCKYNEKGERIKDTEAFAYGFALNVHEHDKSTAYPKIKTVLFDEFMTRGFYLTDEFVTFINVISTIVRNRKDVKIYMCGNTVNKYNPYFTEMGLKNVLSMDVGDLRTYKFAVLNGDTLKIAVEYSDNPNPQGKPSDVYFAFDNPKLKMITNGVWELAIYPRLERKYKSTDIYFTYFICWDEEIVQCEILDIDDTFVTYCHRKTTPLKNEDEDLIYTTQFNLRPNYRRKITKPVTDFESKILWFYKNDKVFYQDNEIGEVVRNYMNWCITDRGFN